MTLIELEQSTDRVVPTNASYVGTRASAAPTVELVIEPESRNKHKPLIDVEEPKVKYDSESDGEFEAFANKTKLAPKRVPSEPDTDAMSERARSPSPAGRAASPVPSMRSAAPEEPEGAAPSPPPPRYMGAGDSFGSFLRGGGVFSETEDGLRRQKSDLLYQYSLKNKDHRYSSKVLTMDCDIREIKDELQFVETRRDMEGSLSLWKTGLVMLAEGIVEVNNRFNPLDIDMREWSGRMWFDVMSKGSYDEVLLELIEKYRSTITMGPELRLLTMMGFSFGNTLLTKKAEKEKLDQLEKLRKAQERQMDSVVEARVKEHLARAAAQERRASPRASPARSQRRSPRRAPSPVELQGPTLTADEIRDLLRDDFLENSVDEPRSPSERAPSPPPPRPPTPDDTDDDARSVSSIPDERPPALTPAVIPTAKKPTKKAAAPRGPRKRKNELIINLDRD